MTAGPQTRLVASQCLELISSQRHESEERVVSFACGESRNPAAAPALIAEAGTHTGRAASEHVTLYRLGGGTLQRVSANGVAEGIQFVVPAGKVLVVTDLGWTAAGDASNAGRAATFRLLNSGQIVHVSTEIVGANGVAGGSEV
jgi:hypothetical protein